MGILACFVFVALGLFALAASRSRQAALRTWQSSFADPARPQAARDRLGMESRKTKWGWEMRQAGRGGRP